MSLDNKLCKGSDFNHEGKHIDLEKRTFSTQFMIRASLVVLLLCVATADAALNVTVSAPKVIGQKADVPLGLKNDLNENVRSARAVVFLLDDQGKVVAQGTKWIIGGFPSSPGLAVGATNVFHFVVDGPKPFVSTNLTTKVTINRIVLEGGRLADVNKNVQIQKVSK
jgi:hypothetical protein